jgi:hypothetical protein
MFRIFFAFHVEAKVCTRFRSVSFARTQRGVRFELKLQEEPARWPGKRESTDSLHSLGDEVHPDTFRLLTCAQFFGFGSVVVVSTVS